MKGKMRRVFKKQIVLIMTAAMLLQGSSFAAFAAEEKNPGAGEAAAVTAEENTGSASGKEAGVPSENPAEGSVSKGSVSEGSVSSDAVSENAPETSNDAEESPAAGVSDNISGSDVSENTPGAAVSEDAVTLSGDTVSENDTSNCPKGYIWVKAPDPGRVSTDPKRKGEEAAGALYPAKFVPTDLPMTRAQKHGTCWTYGTEAMVEGDLIRSGYADSSIDTSEMHVAYFSNWSNKNTTDPLGGTEGDTTTYTGSDYLEQGGSYLMSLQNLVNWSGSVNDDDVISETKADAGTKLDPSEQYLIDKYHVQGIYAIPTAEIDTMKKHIYENGAVGTGYLDYDGFYNSTYNSYYCNTSEYYGNHAVSIVGWDDDFSASKFTYRPEGDGAWLIRNSWSTKGEYSHYAYFWMSYYDKSLDNVSYALEVEPASNYKNNYQYDGDTIFSWSGIDGSGVVYGANIFEVKANGSNNERLDAVGFETYSTTNADYEVYVYKDIKTESDPESGTLCAMQAGTTSATGYYTVKLGTPVELKAGTKFSVVVKLMKSGEKVSIACEDDWMPLSDRTKTVASKNNQSFYKTSESGSFTGTGKDGNVRIKAYTINLSSSGEPENPDTGGLMAIKLEASRKTLKVGKSLTITASPLPKTADLGTLTWKSSDDKIATVDQNGKVTGVSNGDVEITATSGRVTGRISLSVEDNVITSIRLDRTELEMDVGDEVTLIANVTPEELKGNVTWSSSDNSIATVDAGSGKVKALSPGNTEIKVQSKDIRGVSSVCYVRVIGSDVTPEDEKLPEKSDTELWIGGIADHYYTGAAIKPDFNVYDGQRRLYYGSDYTVTYKNNKMPAAKDSAKAPMVTVSFKGNYSGKLTRTFSILPAPFSENVIAEDMAEAYTGKKITLKPVVINRYSGVQLKAGSDYAFKVTVSGGSAVDEIVDKGEYTVTLEPGKNGTYSGNVSFKLTVASDLTNVSKFRVKVTNTTYNKYPQDVKPVYNVTEGKDTVLKSKYVISSDSLVIDEKGMASVIMRGVPAKKTCGTRVIKFKVTPEPVTLTKNNTKVYIESDFIYQKGGLKPKCYLLFNDTTLLSPNVDFVATYQNFTKVYEGNSASRKKPLIKFRGKGRYKINGYTDYNIKRQDLNNLDIQVSDVPIAKSKNFYKKPKVTIIDLNGKKLSQGSDFTFEVEKLDSLPGVGDEVQVTVIGKGNYTGEVYDKSFKIIEADKNLAKAKIVLTGSYTYTRKEIRPTDIKVTLNGQEIDKTCYDIVRYDANSSKGNASLTIRGKNGYGGYKTQNFKIDAKKTK